VARFSLCFLLEWPDFDIVSVEGRASGQVAVIVLVTDGESSDGDVVAALRKLASLALLASIRRPCR
jgi:hypothetical protein